MTTLGLHKVTVQDGNTTRYKLEPDPQDSNSYRAVHRIFEMAKKGQGCKTIAEALNSEGLRTGTGKRWGVTTVHKILTNEAYCGTLVLGGRAGRRAILSGVEPVRLENTWSAIVDKESFLQIQAVMARSDPGIPIPELYRAVTSSAGSSSVRADML